MKNSYIARQAIFDRKLNTIGYELLFRDSPNNQFPDIDKDVATSKLIIQNHIHGDIQALSMGKLAFINFTEKCLINKYPLMFDHNTIVIELIGIKSPSKNIVKVVKFYADKGYKIALTEYDLESHWDIIFDYLTFIKVNMNNINPKRLLDLHHKIKSFNIKLAAEHVETNYQRQSLAEVGFNYYQGYFYHQPEIIEGETLAPIKIQMLNLLTETFQTPINFDNIAEIMSHDVNLTIGLLKMVNNVSTGTKVNITSLKFAVAYLGEEKLKQFVSILALSELTSDEPDEVANQSLITARLMLALSSHKRYKAVSGEAFITGLLSLLDVILHMPIQDIVETMPLAESITKALLHTDGLLGELLDLTKTYILGNSNNMAMRLEEYGIEAHLIQQEFISASKWCHDLNH
jgi:EAL and modified HD-GYP domain-containing signal transduction protein